jgi:uncharacterized protein
MKSILKIMIMLFLTLVLLVAPRIGGFVADLFNYATIDPDGAFMWISVHHIVQALVIVPLMLILSSFFKINFNLGLGDKSEGLKYLKRFVLVFTVYTIIAFLITYLSGGLQPFAYPLTLRNIFGYLGFQLLLSGPSEELIFRAFAISVFAGLVTDKRLNKHLSFAVLFASIIFGIAHISSHSILSGCPTQLSRFSMPLCLDISMVIVMRSPKVSYIQCSCIVIPMY